MSRTSPATRAIASASSPTSLTSSIGQRPARRVELYGDIVLERPDEAGSTFQTLSDQLAAAPGSVEVVVERNGRIDHGLAVEYRSIPTREANDLREGQGEHDDVRLAYRFFVAI